MDWLKGLLKSSGQSDDTAEPTYHAVPRSESSSPLPSRSTGRLVVAQDKKVYWCFWILGAGVLLGWNVLICTIPLLASYFPTQSRYRTDLASWVSTTFCFGNLIFFGLAQRHVGKASPMPRLRLSLLILCGSSFLFAFPVLPLVLPMTAFSPTLTLLVELGATALLCASNAYFQSAVFALAALWGSQETLAVMSGQGGIAVLVAGTQLIIALASIGSADAEGTPSTWAGIALWLVGSVGMLGCLVCLQVLERRPELRQILSDSGAGDASAPKHGGLEMTKRVARKNWRLNLAVAWVFVVCLAVFPPITTAIMSVRSPAPALLQASVFLPFHFLVFNIGDFAGRTYLPSIPALLFTSHKKVLLMSLVRTLFIPLFLACNITTTVSPQLTRSAPLINSDLAYFIILLLFGLSNGYISSLCMILASSPALNPRITESEKDVAGTIAAFFLVAGLAGGSLLSFAVNYWVHGSVSG